MTTAAHVGISIGNGALHEVHPLLHELSYGRQRTCSPHGKTVFPRLIRSRMLAAANDATGGATAIKRKETC